MPAVCFEIENAGGMNLSWKKKAVSDTTYACTITYLSIQWTTSHSDTDWHCHLVYNKTTICILTIRCKVLEVHTFGCRDMHLENTARHTHSNCLSGMLASVTTPIGIPTSDGTQWYSTVFRGSARQSGLESRVHVSC